MLIGLVKTPFRLPNKNKNEKKKKRNTPRNLSKPL